jgi:hypothetical protein
MRLGNKRHIQMSSKQLAKSFGNGSISESRIPTTQKPVLKFRYKSPSPAIARRLEEYR